MLSKNRSNPSFFVALATLALGACAGSDQAEPVERQTFDAQSNRGQAFVVDDVSNPNVLQVALGSADHTTLVAAVQAADLENVLVNAGPLTVFAPTNAAFDALPAGTLEDLLKPENKQVLANIVTSHAAPGKYLGEGLAAESRLYQATGHYVDVEVRNGDTYVNGAKVLATVEASNGVVHVVDKVFLIAAPSE